MSRLSTIISVGVATTLLAAAGTSALGQPQYSIKRIGPLPGGGASMAGGLNNDGQIAGWSISSDPLSETAMFWQRGAGEALPWLGDGYVAYGLGISPTGNVVGRSATTGFPGYIERAALWTRRGDEWQVTNLGLLSGHFYSSASAMSAEDLIVGGSGDGGNFDMAVAWERDDSVDPPRWRITDLGGVPGAFYTWAEDVNRAGVVVGSSGGMASQWQKIDGRWRHSLLPGLIADGYSAAAGINDAGQIVGAAEGDDGVRRAVIWDEDGVTVIGPEGMESEARAINRQGEVVGSGGGMLLLWDERGMHDLGRLVPPDTGWELSWVRDINDGGQILGTGVLGGFWHAFLLTPMTMTLSDPWPGHAGRENTFRYGGSAGGTVWYSFAAGETALGDCGDIPLNLEDAQVLAYVRPGTSSFTVLIPDDWSGRVVYIQMSGFGCEVSNVVRWRFE